MDDKTNIISVTGDIHGCYFTLKSLFDKIKSKTDEHYSVGDLIDRGLYSREVVQFCYENNIKPIKGNHEDMMLNAISDPEFKGFSNSYSNLEIWYANGGSMTQNSYIYSKNRKKFNLFCEEFTNTHHFNYIKSFPLKMEIGNVILTHGGIIEYQSETDVLWNRSIPDKLDKLQIIGHTPVEEFVYVKNHFVNIDTGCVYGNALTAVLVDIQKREILEIIKEELNENDKNN